MTNGRQKAYILRKSLPDICPHARSKCPDCPDICEINTKICLLEAGLPCETYQEYLEELAND